MQDISVAHVFDIMGEIASASDEQSRGISQIAQAVSELDTTTQQNAALVEESSSAANSLEEQSRMLAQAVSVFHLGDDSHPHHVNNTFSRCTVHENGENTYCVFPAGHKKPAGRRGKTVRKVRKHGGREE
nr:hypothetical protein [Dickeya dadantii]